MHPERTLDESKLFSTVAVCTDLQLVYDALAAWLDNNFKPGGRDAGFSAQVDDDGLLTIATPAGSVLGRLTMVGEDGGHYGRIVFYELMPAALNLPAREVYAARFDRHGSFFNGDVGTKVWDLSGAVTSWAPSGAIRLFREVMLALLAANAPKV